MSRESDPTDSINIQVTRRDVGTASPKTVRRPMTAVTIRHVPGGIVSASCSGVTASGMTENAALRELARKVEQAAPSPCDEIGRDEV